VPCDARRLWRDRPGLHRRGACRGPQARGAEPVILNAPPKHEIRARGKVVWIRRADEDLALSNAEWDSLKAGDNNE
jgi:hypothetical protein